jgi:hypothetical protein
MISCVATANVGFTSVVGLVTLGKPTAGNGTSRGYPSISCDSSGIVGCKVKSERTIRSALHHFFRSLLGLLPRLHGPPRHLRLPLPQRYGCRNVNLQGHGGIKLRILHSPLPASEQVTRPARPCFRHLRQQQQVLALDESYRGKQQRFPRPPFRARRRPSEARS